MVPGMEGTRTPWKVLWGPPVHLQEAGRDRGQRVWAPQEGARTGGAGVQTGSSVTHLPPTKNQRPQNQILIPCPTPDLLLAFLPP